MNSSTTPLTKILSFLLFPGMSFLPPPFPHMDSSSNWSTALAGRIGNVSVRSNDGSVSAGPFALTHRIKTMYPLPTSLRSLNVFLDQQQPCCYAEHCRWDLKSRLIELQQELALRPYEWGGIFWLHRNQTLEFHFSLVDDLAIRQYDESKRGRWTV